MKVLVGISAFLLLPLAAISGDLSELPAPLAAKVTQARQACTAIQKGDFALAWGAVTRTDLDGDLHPDWVLDDSAFACSTAASLYCSTGGCMSHFLIDDVVASFQNQGWTALTFGRGRVLLTSVHGSACGGIGSAPCYIAYAWDKEEKVWRSAGERSN